MWYLRRSDPAPFLSSLRFVTFVGSGGKSSLIEYVAKRGVERGKRVVITTTTKIYATEPYVTLESGRMPEASAHGPVRVGQTAEGGKLTGISVEEVERLGSAFDLVLVEGDGAKGRAIKYPAPHEPVIPPCSSAVCVVAGLSALGRTVEESLFRWERFGEAAGVPGEATVDRSTYLRLFSADGMMKGVDRARAVIVLNQFDLCRPRKEGLRLAREITDRTGVDRLYLSAVPRDLFYRVGR